MIAYGWLLFICSISSSVSRQIPRGRASGRSRVRLSQPGPLEMNTDIEDGSSFYNSPLRRNPSYIYLKDDRGDDGLSDREPIKPRKDKKVYVEWLGPDTFIFKGDSRINPKSKRWHPEGIKSLNYNDYKILKKIDPKLFIQQLNTNLNRAILKPRKKQRTHRLDSLEVERQEKLNSAANLEEILAQLRADAEFPKSSKPIKSTSNWREPRTKMQFISPMAPYNDQGMLEITKPKDNSDRNLNYLIKKVISYKAAAKEHSLRQPLTQVFNREEIRKIKQIADAIDEEDQHLDNDYSERQWQQEERSEGSRAELEKLEDLVKENSLSIARSVSELGPNKVDNRAGDSNVQQQVFNFDQLVA